MSRRIEAGSVVLTPKDARVLFQIANLGELRNRFRVSNGAAFQLLTDISIAAFTSDVADIGTETRQAAASEDREWWTTEQLARATGRAARTIRNDLANHLVPATRNSNGWIVRADHAQTYIEGHMK